jgi:hypothetical protein
LYHIRENYLQFQTNLMKKATKQALIIRYVQDLEYLNEVIDLNIKNTESVKQFQKQYRQITELLTELVNTKADDE